MLCICDIQKKIDHQCMKHKWFMKSPVKGKAKAKNFVPIELITAAKTTVTYKPCKLAVVVLLFVLKKRY